MKTDAYQITWLVRRLFRAMEERADAYLQDEGLTAADRAVMEFLSAGEHLTVPDIARRYQVSRQHVQVTVNGLLDRGLLETHANPRHKRSPLLGLSERGTSVFAGIRRKEQRRIDAMFADIEIADIATTKRTLQRLLERIREESPS